MTLQDTEAAEHRYRCGVTRPFAALLTDKYELTMLAAALRDGTCAPSHHLRGIRPPAARRPPLRRRRRHGALRGSVGAVQIRRHRAGVARGFPRPRNACVPRRVPVPRRCRRLRRRRAVLPRLARAVGARHLRRMRGAGDAGVVDLQPRHRDRLRRGAHGQRGRRSAADRDGLATHPRAGRRRRGAGRLHRRVRRGRRTSRRSGATPCPRSAPARMRSRCCTPANDGPDERAAFKAQVDALGVGTTLLVDTYDITAGVANAVEVAGTELGAVRIDSGDLGVLARQVRRTARRSWRHQDPHRGVG